MRTPGRCLNHRGCWLGNGRRDIWVSIGDNFVCPVCGEMLVVPPMPSNSGGGMAIAVAACVVLAAGAGATGFALRHVLSTAQQSPHTATQHAALRQHVPPAAVTVLAQAAIPRAVTQSVAVAVTPLAPFSLNLPVPRAERLAAAPVVPPRAVAPIDVARNEAQAENVAARSADEAPARPAVLPISFGQPLAPESVQPEGRHAWHHRTAPVRHNEILPAPGWPASEDNVVSQVATPFEVAQGDGDDSAPQAVAASYDTPGDRQEAAEDAAYAPASLRGVRMAADVTPRTAPMVVPAIVTRMTVPSMASVVEDAPAQRVDADTAADTAPGDTVKLAQLPAAAPAKLAVPQYPAVAADLQMPGRVRVGCVITVRGEPADCQVTHRVGTPSFATAVMQWLHSGEVRYRPHLVRGNPVPEPHAYDVRFEP